ncbi:hypothetical protein IHV25_05075 [Phaeovibrio sulfidiphilus]|uniref:Uncharacterized protein n=1 Tax=Phaeovibrio sulfidiphilus TaxID=1220600 RepID=A0A8J6YP67_9PROT|nr:hypothetical protein [Phaeovibrio sulfidiphilus]MBE1237016.1 hypothetical protein [Phaeovibrio sulfidiphilus]
MVRSRPLILPALCLVSLVLPGLLPWGADAAPAPERASSAPAPARTPNPAASRMLEDADGLPDSGATGAGHETEHERGHEASAAGAGSAPEGLSPDTAALEFFWSGSIMARDPARPLIEDIQAFETFFRQNWAVTAWRFEDWRETSVPSWRFEVDLTGLPGLDGLSVHGFIPENRRSIRFEEDGCEYFTLDFVRRFVERFPDQADNIAFFNEYDEVTVFEPDLDRATLLSRIRLETPLAENEASWFLDAAQPQPEPGTEPTRPVPDPAAMAALPPRDLLNENALLLLAWRSIWPPSLDGDMSSAAGQYRGPWPKVGKPQWVAPCEIAPEAFDDMRARSLLLGWEPNAADDAELRARLARFLGLAFPERFGARKPADLDDWLMVRLDEARARGFGDDEALVYWPVLAALAGDDFARIPYVDLWLQIEYLSRDDLLDRLLRSANLSLRNPWIAALLASVREGDARDGNGQNDAPAGDNMTGDTLPAGATGDGGSPEREGAAVAPERTGTDSGSRDEAGDGSGSGNAERTGTGAGSRTGNP